MASELEQARTIAPALLPGRRPRIEDAAGRHRRNDHGHPRRRLPCTRTVTSRRSATQSGLLARIVDDLRTISLAEAGDLPLHRAPVDVRPLLEDLARAFSGRAAESGITIDVDADDVLVVDGDMDRLRQALGALLDNAVRHTPRDGRVAIEGRTAADHVRLTVHDSGRGIDPADMPYLFDRFYQADPSRDRSTGTSGLGLAIVRALIEAMGGTTGAENDPAGGARFWIELRRGDHIGKEPT